MKIGFEFGASSPRSVCSWGLSGFVFVFRFRLDTCSWDMLTLLSLWYGVCPFVRLFVCLPACRHACLSGCLGMSPCVCVCLWWGPCVFFPCVSVRVCVCLRVFVCVHVCICLPLLFAQYNELRQLLYSRRQTLAWTGCLLTGL